jgi:methionyl-tRNA formyltransferase|tara:strand:- start:3631 stop:4347 length:717 start_codon:yes stop_codon:yes gene_type:complete
MNNKIERIVIFGINNVGKKIFNYLKKTKKKIYIFQKKTSFEKIKKLDPDIILSLGYRHIIPKKILRLPYFSTYNIHKSLLPMNRGANPVFWTILLNQKAGISIHKMTNKIDDGPIMMQRKIDFKFSDDARSLYEKLENFQLILFKEFWKKINLGKLKKIKRRYKPSYHTKNQFMDMINLESINKKQFFSFLNFLRASTFPPFQNIIIKEKKKNYSVEINIKEIKKIKHIKHGFLKSYK